MFLKKMTLRKKIIFYLILTLPIIFLLSLIPCKGNKTSHVVILNGERDSTIIYPNSIVMFDFIDKLSTKYCIPKHVAFNIAFLETAYRGPFDWKYNPNRTSPSGAVGPMQIMPSTATFINGKKTSTKKLKTDIKLNVETSMKLLSYLYEKYGDWGIVCGAYNTGRPIINKYAKFCDENKNYQIKWVSITY